MVVFCEECGEKYRVDTSKIKGKKALGQCRSCGNQINVSRVEEESQQLQVAGSFAEEPLDKFINEGTNASVREKTEPLMGSSAFEINEIKPKRFIGVRGKMISQFFLVPIVLITIAGFFYMKQINTLSSLIVNVGTEEVKKMAETIIRDHARSTAREVRLYLLSHPDLNRQEFINDPELRKIATQRVGETGYTNLASIGERGEPVRSWIHPQKRLHGKDICKLMLIALGEKEYPSLGRILSAASKGKNIEESGYYLWQENDGSFREKYMVISPVKDTPYFISSTTYIDEFMKPMRGLEEHTMQIRDRAIKLSTAGLLGTILLIGLIVSIYAFKLTKKIKLLTDVSQRISVGELDAEIKVTSKDEIGDLADAISRMQDSIRLSIERLRSRRLRDAA